MNTSFASSVQHSARKNKYPAVKSALLLLLFLFLVFRWWIVHQKLGRELHFSTRWRYIYIYIHTVGGHDHSAFRASDGLSLCTSETDCGFLNCADPRPEPWCFLVTQRRKVFLPSSSFFPTPFLRVYVPPFTGWTNVSFPRRRGIRSSRKRGLVKVWSLWSSGRRV